MPDSSNFSTPGSPLSNASVGSIGNSFSRNIKNDTTRKFRYRVIGVFFDERGNCTHIQYEDTFRSYGKSSLGTSNSNLIAYTSNFNVQIIPEVGEFVEIFNAPSPYSIATDKANPSFVNYWKSTEGSLNIWNTFEGDNKNLDPTVPGQVADTQMASLNSMNYNKSLIGMVPRQA